MLSDCQKNKKVAAIGFESTTKVHFNKTLRSIFIPTLASITTANTIKPIVYSMVPLKVRIISARTPTPSIRPMIVVG